MLTLSPLYISRQGKKPYINENESRKSIMHCMMFACHSKSNAINNPSSGFLYLFFKPWSCNGLCVDARVYSLQDTALVCKLFGALDLFNEGLVKHIAGTLHVIVSQKY